MKIVKAQIQSLNTVEFKNQELEKRINEIDEAGKREIRDLCRLLNDKRFRNKQWEKIWGNKDYHITEYQLNNNLDTVI